MYKFLTDVIENFNDEFVEKLKCVAKKIFNYNNVIY